MLRTELSKKDEITSPNEPYTDGPPIADMGTQVIDDFISETKTIFSHPDLKNIKKTHPHLTAAIAEYDKLQEPLLRLKNGKVTTVAQLKKECESMYENFPGWNIGNDLHMCLDLINIFQEMFFSPQQEFLAKENPKLNPLHKSIDELKKQGDTLLKSNLPIDKAYGKAISLLAIELRLTADNFFCFNNKINDKAEQKKFQDRFNLLINCKKNLLSEHPNYAFGLKLHLRNIAKALLIVCSLVGIPIYIAITDENPFKLFCKPKTDARKLLDKIEIRKAI